MKWIYFLLENQRKKFVILATHGQIDVSPMLQSFTHTNCSKNDSILFFIWFVFKEHEWINAF